MVRSLWLQYTNSITVAITYQFMLGESVLVCPVLDPHKTNQRCYLPPRDLGDHTEDVGDDDIWVHLWTGTEYSSTSQSDYKSVDKDNYKSGSKNSGSTLGRWIEVRAPIGEIPVFYRKNFRYSSIMKEMKDLHLAEK